MQAPAVELLGIERRFGAQVANAGVTVRFQPGSIHALVGENGAGKSTLMRILFGLVRPDAGEIRVDGRSAAFGSPTHALRCGIGMIHQHFMLVPAMTVLENAVLGYPGLRGLRRLPRARLSARFAALAAGYGFALDPGARVESLGVGERQRVEIARLLFHGARLLICDEPTAVLAPPEVAALFEVLRRLRAEGRTVVFITHKLSEVLALADRVTVLRRGRVVGEAERERMDHARLVRWIVGEGEPALDAAPGAPPAARVEIAAGRGDPPVGGGEERALVARDLTVRGGAGLPSLERVSFELHRGEILGVAGVQGNGQRELAECVAGRLRFDAGVLRLGGRDFAPGARIPAGMRPALIPEDRSSEGLIARLSLWENLLLGSLDDVAFLRRGWFAHRAARRWAEPLLRDFRVTPAAPELAALALSGGNQQKLLCARELARRPRVLVAAQPTRGVDVAGTRFLHERLREFCRGGGSVLLVSADLDEILTLADRIGVLYRGRLTAPRARAAADLEWIGRAMVGMES